VKNGQKFTLRVEGSAGWRKIDTSDVQIGQKLTRMVQVVQIREELTLVMCILERS